MQKNTKKRLKKGLFSGVGVVLAAVLIGTAGTPKWERFFYTTAVISAGLQRPIAGMSALSNALSAANSEQEPLTTTPSSTQGTSATDTTTITTTTTTKRPINTETLPTIPVPENKGDGGKILEQTLSAGTQFVNGVAIRNRSRVSISLEKEANSPSTFVLSEKDGPKVLIVHTHTTENYMLYEADFYNNEDAQRERDEQKNVCAVGAMLAKRLNQSGIKTLHDTTQHDYPKYSGAYTRSSQTVQDYLKQYPTIQVVVDLHRDSIMQNTTDKIKPTVTVNGQKAAQMMFVMGVADTAASPHPNWRENLHFSMELQRAMHTTYEGIMRPISLTNSRYNQHLSSAYLLVEMGSDANTLAEAVYSAQLLGDTMAELMLSKKDERN